MLPGCNRARSADISYYNQIPEVYLQRIIRACSNQGDLVLDPFLGSGTTLTVARALGRRSIGIEYSPVHAASGWERIIDVGMVREAPRQGRSNAIFQPRRKRPAGYGEAALVIE